MISFLCPVCGETLTGSSGALACGNRHSFDVSSDGYVNLNLGKGIGDDRMMCRARRDFLRKGYYSTFADAIASTVKELFPEKCSALDAGCGEGYYLRRVSEGYPDRFEGIGIDLAKDSVRYGARLEKGGDGRIRYAVCGIFDMPFEDNAFDCLLSVFAPVPEKEAHRVLKHSGYMLVCHPGAEHLDGMKRAIYESTYENDETPKEFSGFRHIKDVRCRYPAHINKEDQSDLLAMTPYYWRTPRDASEKYLALDGIDTTLDFIISVYEND